jgi:hypothetical protein
MKFRNPWIDPRIVQVRSEDAQAYLARHGWQLVGPASNPHLLRYERGNDAADASTLFLPVRVEEGAALQWMIDLIGDLARHEDRWAVDVVTDILSPEAAAARPANGASPAAKAEPAPR